MNRSKEDRACRLYLAMSELDDRMATEALNYRSNRTSAGARFAIILAACLSLVITFSLFAAVIANFEANDAPGNAPPSQSEKATLASVLELAKNDDINDSSSSAKAPDLFDGRSTIIWRYSDSDLYYSMTISEQDLKSLVSEIKNGSDVSAENAENDCMVWLSYGNGQVVSPYLEPSAGNIGYGVLFEYDPELEPSSSFVSSVSSILD